MESGRVMAKAPRVENKLDGREKSSGVAALMTPKMIISLVLIGIFSFTALVTLSGYAGDLRKKDNGQAHALSRSAIGFGGLVRLLGDMEYDVRMARTENISYEDEYALRVFTMSRPYMADGLNDLNLYSPTLIVMPKWRTTPLRDRSGWVQKGRGNNKTFDMSNHERDLKELLGDVEFTRHASDDKLVGYNVESNMGVDIALEDIKIRNLQTIDGPDLVSIVSADEGSILVYIDDTETYILSDPDFLNTMGIESRTRAKLAVDLVDSVISLAGADTGRVDFDLTFHGLGGKTNIVKVMTQPPFLAATLCLLAAGLLIAWQAFSRFGDPIKVQRDYALGKFSLADNAARFISIAGREPNMAKDYAALVKKQVVKNLNMAGRKPKEIDTILARREITLEVPHKISDLEQRSRSALDSLGLMQLAKDLDIWKSKMIIGEN